MRCILSVLFFLLCAWAQDPEQRRKYNATASTSSGGGTHGVGNNYTATSVVGEEDAHRLGEEQRERRRVQAEVRKRRIQREKEREGIAAAKRTLLAASTEACDWKSAPLAILKGSICGVHYKVLGVDRKREFDKSEIKKAYRQKSLMLHPDKNHAPEASTAFKIIQEAYECLSSDECRQAYDESLITAEKTIAWERDQTKQAIVHHSLQAAGQLHYYLSVAANHVYQAGLDIWDLAGEVEINIIGVPRPVGRIILSALLFLRARFLLKLHAASYIIMRLNFELAKARGIL